MLIIAGWMDRIDGGFTETAGDVCEDAIGSGCQGQHAEKGDWCHYTLCRCNAACTQSPQYCMMTCAREPCFGHFCHVISFLQQVIDVLGKISQKLYNRCTK